MNVTEAWQKPPIDFLPVSDHELVTVAGRQLPEVTAQHNTDGTVHIYVGASGFTCGLTEAETFVRAIATALAVGAGYVGWPDADAEFVVRPFAPRTHLITPLSDDPGAS